MKIQHNITALNTYNKLSRNTNEVSKSLEKLSSGYSINKAGDDAAGLAISEKMRGQINGLNQASKNAQDAISLVQTAEGGLNEVHSMLQRGRELAVQAANDTYTLDDREKIQAEITQLNEEIDAIADRTEFNTRKLMKSESGMTSSEATKIKEFTNKLATTMLGQSEKMVNDAYGITPTSKFDIDVIYEDGKKGGWAAYVTSSAGTPSKPINLTIDKADFFEDEPMWIEADRVIAHEMVHAVMAGSIPSFSTLPGWFKEGTAEYVAGANERVLSSLARNGGSSATVVSKLEELVPGSTSTSPEYTSDAYTAGYLATKFLDAQITAKDSTKTIKDFMGSIASGVTFDNAIANYTSYANADAFKNAFKGSAGETYLENMKASLSTSTGSILAGKPGYIDTDEGIVPDTPLASTMFNYKWADSTLMNTQLSASNLTFQIGANEGQNIELNLPVISSGILATKNISVLSHEAATSAIETFDHAIKSVSSSRSSLGALQNRLEHTINNLNTSAENLTSAESRIRDTDMAAEMMKYTKNNILMQAAQSMLSQANQQPQGVLSLLN